MDRRTFALALSGLGLGLLGCADADPTAPAPPGGPGTPPPAPPAPSPGPSLGTAAERALAVAAGLVRAAEPVADGLRWATLEDGAAVYRTDLYSGQAGVLAFLAEVHRFAPGDALRGALEGGGRWLERQRPDGTPGLFAGSAGRAWAFLSLHEALGGADSPWLAAALRLAPTIASGLRGSAGDLFTGLPGQGLLLLRLHAVTGDRRWLAAATDIADAILPRAVRVGDGIKFAIGVIDGRTTYYVGMAHGTAGVAYFLCRLAEALPAAERGRYLDAARSAAIWLDSLARPTGDGTNWYRREPDQMEVYQAQWCHGAAGIGLLYADLYRVTREAAYLTTATRAAAQVEAHGTRVGTASQCHGLAGNADLFLKLFRETGDARWLAKAAEFAELAWARRYRNTEFPGWPSADGHDANNPGLMTGTAGVGWLYLQLARDGRLTGAVTG